MQKVSNKIKKLFSTALLFTFTLNLFLGGFPLYLNKTAIAASPVSFTISGSYVGNGTDDRLISGLGFQPDVVIVKGDADNEEPVLRTSTVVGDFAKPMLYGSSTFISDTIQSFNTDGFTVGTNVRVNNTGTTYHWIAFKKAAGAMEVGTYTGDGNTTQAITGIGFRPEYVMLFPEVNTPIVHRSGNEDGTALMPNGAALASDGMSNSGRINSLDANGFTVGNSSFVNTNDVTYHYIAWNQIAGRMKVGTYGGNATDNRDITGVGFLPELVIVSPSSFGISHLRSSSIGDNTVDKSIRIADFKNSADKIQKLYPDADNPSLYGFQVGASNDVNENGVNMYWMAFVRSAPPTYEQSGYRIFQNTDSADVGSSLGGLNTEAVLSATGEAFRLRMLMHVGNDQLSQNGEDFKLQFVDKNGGTCAAPGGAGTPSSYTDVTSSTIIGYKNNLTPIDGSVLTSNINDPTHGGHIVVSQTYEEENNFSNTQSAILNGQEGEWDFSLYDNNAAASTDYCFRIVKSDGTTLNTYSVYPQITTAVGDITAPQITSVTSSTGNGSYNEGDSISIQIVFSEAVNVSGSPTLTLETGATDAVVDYASGSGTDTLTFNYTVGTGESSSDLDYTGIDALSLNGGSIKDAALNDADITLANPGAANSLGNNKSLAIDTTAPIFSSVTPSSTSSINNVTDSSDIGYTLSENINNGTITVTRTGGTADPDSPHTCNLTGTALASGSHTIDFSDTTNGCSSVVTLVDGAIYTFAFSGTDEAGNVATTVTRTGVTFDIGAAYVTSVTSSTGNGSYNEGDSISIQIVFSEAVNVSGSPTLTLETGATDAVVDYASGSGTDTLTFNYTVGTGESSSDLDYTGTDALSLNGGSIKDAALNDADITLPAAAGANSLAFNKNLQVVIVTPETPDEEENIPEVTSTPSSSQSGGGGFSVSKLSKLGGFNNYTYGGYGLHGTPKKQRSKEEISLNTAIQIPKETLKPSSNNTPPQKTAPNITNTNEHWAEPYLTTLYEKGIETNTVTPDETITRSELTYAIMRTFHPGQGTYQPIFKDLSPRDKYANEISEAAKIGIIEGYYLDDGLPYFLGDKKVTRAEALKIILLSKIPDIESLVSQNQNGFSDIKKDDWIYPYAQYAKEKNFISGYEIKNETEGKVSEFYRLNRSLIKGDQGPEVQELQEILKALGYYEKEADGIFDEDLMGALQEYQTAKVLPETGYLGPLTRKSLQQERLKSGKIYYFKPNQLITRGEVAKLLVLVSNLGEKVISEALQAKA